MSPAPTAPGPNPYNCSVPGRSFVGYEDLRQEVRRGFLNESSYALLGGRRCGKTSLLMKLQEELQQGGVGPFQVLPRFLSMQSFVPRDPFQFFSHLYTLIGQGLKAPAWDSPPPQQVYQEFLKRLDELHPQLERAHGARWLVVLLMDELDAAPKHLRDSDECFQNLRNLLMESRFKAYFRVVASGCSEMGKLIGSGSPLNNLAKIYTRVLTENETRALVAKGFPEGLSPETEEELLRHTGRHPYLLQGLLEKLYEGPRPPTPEKVQSASELFSRDHGSDFKVWHDDVGDSGRACYAELAHVAPEGRTPKQLRERVARPHSISDGLLALSYHGLIHEEPSGQRRLAGTLFKDWFLDHSAPPAPGPTPMTTPARNQIFISYSHKDTKWLERLETHLKPRIRNGKLDVWNDKRLKAGDEWRKEIDDALARAKVAVLLVSPHFLASDFIADNELPPLLEAARQGGVKILWVPVSTCAFKEAKLDVYQAVLDPAKPLDKHHHAYVNDAMEKICQAISQAFST